MNEDTNVQDKEAEGNQQPELHTEQKPNEEAELPEDANDRTREQFEKLKKTNQEMSNKLRDFENKSNAESVLDSLKPKAAPQAPNFDFSLKTPTIEPDEEQLIDEQGYVNANVLQKSITDAKNRAEKAEREAQAIKSQFVNYEETQQTKLANEKYPELNPHSDKFDNNFYKLVRNELIGQMANGEKDVVKAAAEVRKYYKGQTESIEKPAEQKQDTQSDEKQQINAGQKRSTQTSYNDAEESQLITATRLNKKGALAERLKRAGY